jgi:hypothetical protein
MQRTTATPDPRGLLLVALVAAWLAGILLDQVLLVPSHALLAGAGAALVLVVVLWHLCSRPDYRADTPLPLTGRVALRQRSQALGEFLQASQRWVRVLQHVRNLELHWSSCGGIWSNGSYLLMPRRTVKVPCSWGGLRGVPSAITLA